jgi:hypothetical protein
LKEIMRSLCSLLISAAAAVAASAQAAPPARVDIAYEVFRDGSRIAEVAHSFEHAAGRYRIVETWKGRGLYSLAGEVVRSSRGAVTAAGPRPHEFTDERSRRAPTRATFDWAARVLATHHKGESHTQPLPEDAQDRLSFLLALAFAPPDKLPAVFSVTDGGGLSRYIYESAGRERVKVAAGEFDALKVSRKPARADDRRTTEIWLAPTLGYLPVRIVFTEENGTRLDQQAARFTLP